MRVIIIISALILLLLVSPYNSRTYNNNSSRSHFSKNKILIKTRSELKVSEATGKISLITGIGSLDDKIINYSISGIENLFRLNNGDAEIFEKFGMGRIYVFNIDENSDNDIEKMVKQFNEDDNIEFCEPDFIGESAGVKEMERKMLHPDIPDDVMFYKQWYLQNSGSVEPSSSGGFAKVGADIKILSAWEIEQGSEEVIVAILDSGIKDEHPDLKQRMWINKNEIPNNGIDDDQNGYVDDIKGWDFAYDDRRPDDGFGHGTNIATVIGANTNNSLGFAGVDRNCRLMNCKNLNSDNSGEYSWWAESIKYAVDNGANIINMSEGGDDFSQVLETAIEYAIESGVLVNAAMMNRGDGRDYYPASYEGVFAVGATDTDDKRCRRFSWGGGSCWGDHISVVAPGNKIYGLDYENDESYDVYWSGTSQSTAIVSGISALLLAQDRTRSDDELKRIMKLSARDMIGDIKEDKPGWDRYYGYGRVDSYYALTFENNDLKKKETELLYKKDTLKTEEKKVESAKEVDKTRTDQNEERPAKARERRSDDN